MNLLRAFLRPFLHSLIVVMFCITLAMAQEPPGPARRAEEPESVPGRRVEAAEPVKSVILPSGTKVLLIMKNTVSTRNAKAGDGVYLETQFPVVADGKVVIPTGTFVQGVVDSVRRSGRVKGRAEILLHFTTLIYPNGYTVSMPAALESADSSDAQKVKDKEGTVQAEGTKGRDAATIATTTGTGTMIGGLSLGTMKAAGIGSGLGAAVGIATALFTRGEEVRLETGTSVEMVITRSLELDPARIDGINRYPQSFGRSQRMEKQVLTPSPSVNGIPLPR